MQKFNLIFSDIHSNTKSLKKINSISKKKGVKIENTIFLGDMFDRGNKAQEVLNFFYENINKEKYFHIMGNHDEMLFAMLGFIDVTNANNAYDMFNPIKIFGYHVANFHLNNGYETLKQLFNISEEEISVLKDSISYIIENVSYENIFRAEAKIVSVMKKYYDTDNYKKLQTIFENSKYSIVCDNIMYSHSGNELNTWEESYNSSENIVLSVIGHKTIKKDRNKKIKIEGVTSSVDFYNNKIFIDNGKCDNVLLLNKDVVKKIKGL